MRHLVQDTDQFCRKSAIHPVSCRSGLPNCARCEPTRVTDMPGAGQREPRDSRSLGESDQAFGALRIVIFRQLANGRVPRVRSRTHRQTQSEVHATALSPQAGNRQTYSCCPTREVRCWCFRGTKCVRHQGFGATRSHDRRRALPVCFPSRPLAPSLQVSATGKTVHRHSQGPSASRHHPQPRWHRTDVSVPCDGVRLHAAGGLESPDRANFRQNRPRSPSLAGQGRHGERWFSTAVGMCEQVECLSCTCPLLDLDFVSRLSARIANPGTAKPGFNSEIALKRAPNLQTRDRKRHFGGVASHLTHPSPVTGELPAGNAPLFPKGKPEHFLPPEKAPLERPRIPCQPQQHQLRIVSLCRGTLSQGWQFAIAA